MMYGFISLWFTNRGGPLVSHPKPTGNEKCIVCEECRPIFVGTTNSGNLWFQCKSDGSKFKIVDKKCHSDYLREKQKSIEQADPSRQ
jgi:hypothetical protein